MRKAKSLLGLNVISQLEGKQLGHVRDLIFDDNSQRLVALLLSDRELFGMIDAVIVPYTQVRDIGRHAVMVPNAEAVVKAHSDPVLAEAYDQNQTLDGKKITTQSGEDLGRISDLYIDAGGNITGYEISGGILADAFSGKRYMPAPESITIGEDVVLVPHSIVDELKVQEPGGLSKAYKNTAESVSASTAGLGSKVSQIYQNAQSGVQSGLESARTSLAESYANIAHASVEKQREFVIGKVAGNDVVIPSAIATMETPETIATDAVESGLVSPSANEIVSPIQQPTHAEATDITSDGEVVSGEVLVRKGEVITAEHADRAIATGILGQLVLSAANQSLNNVTTDGRSQLTTASNSAQGTLERAAVGKPAAREVLAPDGSVLVAPGMIITPEILANAYLHGKKGEVIAVAGLGAASQSISEARENAVSLWDQIKGKTAELTGKAQDRRAEYAARAEANRINAALGRPVTRVILDRQDNVILNTGDIITNTAVDRAREAGVLDILLDSVSNVVPEITPEMLRVQERGQAALDSQAEPASQPSTVPPDGRYEVTNTPPQRIESEEYHPIR